MFERLILNKLEGRIKEKRKFMQVLYGPRQVGKTTVVKQLMEKINMPYVYISADAPMLKTSVWIEKQWEVARAKIKKSEDRVLLVLDEIQKIPDWSEVVKKLWDEDTYNELNLYLVILGSSPLLVQKGLTESLAGRFEILYVTHWSYPEMRAAFGWNIDEYIFYGGYPAGSELINDFERWSSYILNSLIETSISRDILLMTRIDKPVLLRQLFELGCQYSTQILSFQKIVGQLQDAGNTVTLAHYLNLLSNAGLLTGLFKYSGSHVRHKASSPKFLVLNTALLSAELGLSLQELKEKKEVWGRLVESTVGAHLVNGIKTQNIKLYYWRENNREVDFLLMKGKEIIAIEVKSGREKRDVIPGMDCFCKKFSVFKKLLVGKGGIPVEEFLSIPPDEWFKETN